MDDNPPEPVRLLEDRYALLHELGPGRRAKTWYARDREADRPVVVKQLELGEAPDWKAVELFEREAEILQSLELEQTPNYVDHLTPEESGDAHDFHLIYEYVEGVDLETALGTDESLDNFEVRYTTHKLLQILAQLHRREPPIVHRDVKPSNIVRRPDGSLALIDFGAVQLVSQDTVGGSTIVGTTGYFPPEQLMGRATPASDLYGVGATAVHLLTGRNPNELEVEKNRIKYRDVADVRPDFGRFLDRLLAPAPEDRFADAVEALDHLESEVLTRQSLGHRIASSARHAVEEIRRTLGAGGTWAVALACLTLGTGAVALTDWRPTDPTPDDASATRETPSVSAGRLVDTFEDGAVGWAPYGPTHVDSESASDDGVAIVSEATADGESSGIEKTFDPAFRASTLRVRLGGQLPPCRSAGLWVADGDGRERALWKPDPEQRDDDGFLDIERRMREFELPSFDTFVVRVGGPRQSETPWDSCRYTFTMTLDRLALVSEPAPPEPPSPDAPEPDPPDEPPEPKPPEPEPPAEPPESDRADSTCGDVPIEEGPIMEIFDDDDLAKWTPQYTTRSARLRPGRVIFEGSSPDNDHGRRHGSKAIWHRIQTVDDLGTATVGGRFKMDLPETSRDQTNAVRYELLDDTCDKLGTVAFYTRWEGRRGTLSDRCRGDHGRGWCTYRGKNPYIDDGGTRYRVDIGARKKWASYRFRLEPIVDRALSGVDPDDVAMIRVEIRSRGAWSTNGRAAFQAVRLQADHREDTMSHLDGGRLMDIDEVPTRESDARRSDPPTEHDTQPADDNTGNGPPSWGAGSSTGGIPEDWCGVGADDD